MELSWQRRALKDASEILEKEGSVTLALDLKRIAEIGDLDDSNAFRSRGLQALFDTFEHEDENHEISALLKEICDCLDLKNMSFFVLQEPRGRILTERAFTTYSKAWVDFYVERRFWLIDPTIGEYFESGNDQCWENITEKRTRTNPLSREFFRMADEFDIGKRGFVRYFDFSLNGVYAITMTSDQSQQHFTRMISDHRNDIDIMASYFVDYLLGGEADINALVRNLREDETMIMRLLASGMEERSIMKYMGIGRELFDIISGVKRKLEVNTVQQAIYKIAKSTEVQIIPPLPHEIYRFMKSSESTKMDVSRT